VPLAHEERRRDGRIDAAAHRHNYTHCLFFTGGQDFRRTIFMCEFLISGSPVNRR